MTDSPLTVGASLFRAAGLWPDRTALIIAGRQASYRGLLDEASLCARGLAGLGVKPGDRIGTLMHNCWESVILFYGASLIGAGLLPFNARYRGDELSFTVGFSDVVGLFTTAHGREHVELPELLQDTYPILREWKAGEPLKIAEAPSLRFVANLADPEEERWVTEKHLAEAAQRVSAETVEAMAAAVKPGDNCITMFSSGTTARPKACMLSHENVSRVGSALAERFEMTADDRFWDPLPFYHMSTLMPLAACRTVGATFIGVEHFEAGAALAEIERTRATILYPAFPTLMASMVAHPDFPHRNLSTARLMLNIGAPDLLRRFCEAMPGAKQASCYGLTEGGGVSVWSDKDDTLDERIFTSGKPITGTKVRVVDPDTLEDKPFGENGEIWLWGYCVFSGYYKDPEMTAAVITPDGWLRTNDIGHLLPSGHLVYKGRLKDMLKIGGENVAAVEIESFLMKHPAIKMAQVVSVPDERLVEAAAAFIECMPGKSITPEEVVKFCAGQMASFKIPRHVQFVNDWPMSTTKIQKFKLLENYVPSSPLDVSGIARALKRGA
ncbi:MULTISPECIES: AMP-binding protein [unclassified Chelatococcus]|uniref:AMP-binding protein n=1 Tax=unclassified Chelatococcus TaxID=2638111 RepID=UPI001BCDBB5E|nr:MULTISPECIES: AMP-binding protein [unclassified Chelatococcus]MBS7743435.1 AMP-binding protein [Chelatococcus sp. HY11]MBX3547188.1 AMP-binding protein [Chelatococcus sp.]CAH1663851.1 Fatty-acyl-CoA synthase [Hyphomicrobiales bacterium]CAH1687941.1 Fatty-acyl-CoA synthase [Hyphomicrobiales bacterium]